MNWILKLDHLQITIPTGMENKAREFYSDILGLREIEKPEILKANGGLWYQLNDLQLHLGTEAASGKSKRHPAFETTQIDKLLKHLKQHSVLIKEDQAIPGITRFSCFDPFGNRIEFLEKHKQKNSD
ncbi:MAG: catechol 2,3-dioxygenase-like lactoylglutathione lyase family enzyme [Limisphaerales bacterium]|jgi:catechol 2,3-dioxygenase-like lactoylglutathione lyase family enzyme